MYLTGVVHCAGKLILNQLAGHEQRGNRNQLRLDRSQITTGVSKSLSRRVQRKNLSGLDLVYEVPENRPAPSLHFDGGCSTSLWTCHSPKVTDTAQNREHVVA